MVPPSAAGRGALRLAGSAPPQTVISKQVRLGIISPAKLRNGIVFASLNRRIRDVNRVLLPVQTAGRRGGWPGSKRHVGVAGSPAITGVREVESSLSLQSVDVVNQPV